MNDIVLVIKYSKLFEAFLEDNLGATGRGLHQKVDSVENIIPENIEKELRRVATVRNKLIHDESFTSIKNRQDFVKTCQSLRDFFYNKYGESFPEKISDSLTGLELKLKDILEQYGAEWSEISNWKEIWSKCETLCLKEGVSKVSAVPIFEKIWKKIEEERLEEEFVREEKERAHEENIAKVEEWIDSLPYARFEQIEWDSFVKSLGDYVDLERVVEYRDVYFEKARNECYENHCLEVEKFILQGEAGKIKVQVLYRFIDGFKSLVDIDRLESYAEKVDEVVAQKEIDRRNAEHIARLEEWIDSLPYARWESVDWEDFLSSLGDYVDRDHFSTYRDNYFDSAKEKSYERHCLSVKEYILTSRATIVKKSEVRAFIEKLDGLVDVDRLEIYAGKVQVKKREIKRKSNGNKALFERQIEWELGIPVDRSRLDCSHCGDKSKKIIIKESDISAVLECVNCKKYMFV